MGITAGLLGLGRTGLVVARSLHSDELFDFVFAVTDDDLDPKDYEFKVEPKERIDALVDEYNLDVVLDFTNPEAVLANIEKLKDGTAYVIATTGFSDEQLEKLKDYNKLKIVVARNISDGINIVLNMCELLNSAWKHADVEIIEEHFRGKKDSPSGTAKVMSDVFEKDAPVHSVRAGGITGVHNVILATENQKITIKHESFNKDVFAEGAKKAALWAVDKDPGYYDVREVYN